MYEPAPLGIGMVILGAWNLTLDLDLRGSGGLARYIQWYGVYG
jgi:uncharacterized membrane protein YiaA